MIKTLRIKETGYGTLTVNVPEGSNEKDIIQTALENGEFVPDDDSYDYEVTE